MRVRVSISYTWEFDKKEWSDTKDHWDTVQNELNTKIKFDAVDAFYHLRDIHFPVVSGITIEKVDNK